MTVWPDKKPATWVAILKATMKTVDDRNLPLIAAGVAFYSLLSLFPTITAAVSVWGLFANPVAIEEQLDGLSASVPAGAFDIIETQVQRLAAAPSDTLTWAGVLAMVLALWSARAAIAALIRGLNAIYEERHRKGLKRVFRALTLTFLLVFMTTIFVAIMVVAPVLIAFAPLGPLAETALRALKWLVILVMLLVSLGLIYRLAPNRKAARVPWVSPGAVLATGLWTIASAALSLYLENFGNYNEIYGSLGAVIALLMWFFVSAFVVLLGAAVNAQLERHTKEDSTVGPPKPLGARGAVVADTYVPDS